ncbi:hypothetical protein ACFL6U_15090 [Planctomycetota bacterium]
MAKGIFYLGLAILVLIMFGLVLSGYKLATEFVMFDPVTVLVICFAWLGVVLTALGGLVCIGNFILDLFPR